MTGSYLDTSALAKWYLNEPFSEKFESFIQEQPSAAISRLTVVELRCLLARRRRAGEITKTVESRVFAAFEEDARAGFLQIHPVADEHLIAALGLITRLADSRCALWMLCIWRLLRAFMPDDWPPPIERWRMQGKWQDWKSSVSFKLLQK